MRMSHGSERVGDFAVVICAKKLNRQGSEGLFSQPTALL